MWDTIKEIFTGDNSIFVIIFLILLTVLITLLIKNNYIRITTKHVKIGEDEKERSILRQQTEWSYQYVIGLYSRVVNLHPEVDKVKTRYVLELIYDEIVTWILFNHVSRAEAYVAIKQDKLRNMLYNLEVAETIWDSDFIKMIDKCTKEIINRIVDIREYYTDKVK